MTGPWRKSSRSSTAQGNCVEARQSAGQAQIRDSKMGDGSPILQLSRSEFAALLDSVNN